MDMIVELIDIKEDLKQEFLENRKLFMDSMPEFSHEIRIRAFEDFCRLGIPKTNNEEYRYTRLEPLFNKEYKRLYSFNPVKVDKQQLFSCDVPNLDTRVEFVINGWYYHPETQLNKLANGVIIGSLAEAAKQYPELVSKHYGQYANSATDGLVALNTAFAMDGFFMFIPPNVIFDQALQLINMMMHHQNLMAQPRNLIILEENSEANLLICDHTLSDRNFLSNSITEIVAGKNARFHLTKMQNENNDSAQLAGIFVHQEANSQVSTNTISLHGGFIYNRFDVKLNGRGANNETFGLFLTDRNQHISNRTLIDHAVPDATSTQTFKGVLDDEATGSFTGKILVQRDAQRTLAYQTNKNILLTDKAKMNSKPMLEIFADDVKCSHGATIGQLDDNALFYLRTRGISANEARLLLMYAFANEVISAIKIEGLRQRVEELVSKRLRGELSRCNDCNTGCH